MIYSFLFYILQNLLERIKENPSPGRAVPDSVDPHILGLDLKFRLAAKAPIFQSSVTTTGLCNIVAYYPEFRDVPIYEFDEEKQESVEICVCKVPCFKQI